MASWTDLETTVLREVNEEAGVFHTAANIRSLLEHAELLVAATRTLSEKTGTLTFSASQPVYTIHSIFRDFILPLRITVNNALLRPTSLTTLSRLDPEWQTSTGVPEAFFMIGTTLLGFYRTPGGGSAEVTYLAMPPTTFTTPASGTAPFVGVEWHTMLAKYAQAMALAKESEIGRAEEKLTEFAETAGIPREVRLTQGSSQRTPEQTHPRAREAKD